jgi:cell division protein FtsB
MRSPAPAIRPGPFSGRRVLALLAALACGWAAYALYGAAAEDHALSAGVASLQATNASLQQQIAERSLEVREAQGSAWIEEQARRLGFHLPGEHIYVVAPGGQRLPSSGGINAPLPTYSPPPAPTSTPAATPTPVTTATPSAAPALLPPGTPSPSPGGSPSPRG